MVVSKEVSSAAVSKEDLVRGLIAQGFTYQQIADKIGVVKGTISKWMKKWDKKRQEIEDKIYEKEVSTLPRKRKQNGNHGNAKPPKKSSKKSSKKSKPKLKSPPQIDFNGDEGPQDPDQGDETPKKEIEISPQFKEIIGYVEYAADRVERVTTGDILKFYEKTKMLENEEKDFEEDNLLLSKFEALVRQYDGLYMTVPQPLTPIDTADPQPEEGM